MSDKKEIFRSMQEQLVPGPRAEEALMEILSAETAGPKRRPIGLWAAAAACAALALLAWPVSRAFTPAVPLHSYEIAGGGTGANFTYTQGGRGEPVDALTDLTEDMGSDDDPVYSGAEVAADRPFDPEAASQEEVMAAHQNLMAYFEAEYGPETYPDWYGGSYIQGNQLIVNVVDPEGEMDKEFLFRIQTWAGGGTRSDAVGFGSVKYPLSRLQELQAQVSQQLVSRTDLETWALWTDEIDGKVVFEVPRADDDLLAVLAELDPDDDAIRVRVSGEKYDLTAADAPMKLGAEVEDLDR